jgi:pseudoazurin
MKTSATMALLLVLSGSMVSAKTIEIKMLNNGKDGIMVFEPGYVKAAKGDTIKFKSVDPGHVTASVLTPAGAKPWKGELNKDLTYKVEKEGVYVYHCEPHAAMAMAGVIQVGAATNLEDAKKAAAEEAKKFAMNKDRLDKYLAQVK